LSRLSTALKIFAIFPPLLLLAGTVGMVACGGSIFPTVTATTTHTATPTGTTTHTATPTGTTPTATPTGTASPSTLAFVTNFNSGTISEFTRNTTTGGLTRVDAVAAGSKQGPKGMAITPNNSFLYATNFVDNTILEYSIHSNGTLVSIGAVSDGSGSGPEMIAINPAGTFLWVTNFGNGTISAWSIGSDGALTAVQTISNLSGPFGLVLNSSGSILYVADNKAGLIYTFTVNSNGTLSQSGVAVPSLPTGAKGSPGLITIDPTGSFLYVDDLTNGVVIQFNITTGSPVVGTNYPATFTGNVPVGIGIAVLSSINYVLTANQGAGNTWAFQILNGGTLSLPPLSSGSVSSPTGLAVDPQNAFAYTANQGDGTVGIFQLNVRCPSIVQAICQSTTIATETNPPSNGSAPFAVVLTH
jgi:6-phosphogluconolactonase (cycloisomerase 2 family)